METTKNKLLKEADSRVQDAIKVFADAKASLDESQTLLIMSLGYSFQKLYDVELTSINDGIKKVVDELSELAKKVRVQLKQ